MGARNAVPGRFRLRACEYCGLGFYPRSPNHKLCTPYCAKRDKSAKRHVYRKHNLLRRKKELGRICPSCDRSDSQVAWGDGKLCATCARRAVRNGRCGVEGCEVALRHGTGVHAGRFYCPRCLVYSRGRRA